MHRHDKLPTPTRIRHARELLSTRLFGPATVARRSGIPLAAVFRIARTLPREIDSPLPCSPQAVENRLRCFCELA